MQAQHLQMSSDDKFHSSEIMLKNLSSIFSLIVCQGQVIFGMLKTR